MKGKDIAITTLAIVAGILLLLFFYERDENKKLEQKIDDLHDDKFKLLQDNIKSSPEISEEVKSQLEKLIREYEFIHPKASIELRNVLEQIKVGQDIKAIRDLAKIVENLLKDKYKDEPKFSKLKMLPLKSLIDHAREVKLFNTKQYNSACILHQFRNEESHELAVTDSENMKLTALLGGTEIILLLRASYN